MHLSKYLSIKMTNKIVRSSMKYIISDKQISILETLDHPNVIKYSESFNHNNKFCIVMEYADKGDLSHLLKKYMTSNKLIEEELVN